MCRVHGDQRAQNAAGDYIADEMVIRRHKAQEHRSGEHCRYNSSAGHGDHPDTGKSQDSAGVPRRKAADVVASLKRMETIRAGADKRWIIMGPRLRPIAT